MATRFSSILFAVFLTLNFFDTRAATQEEVLFFDGRPDQTVITNGGTVIWSLTGNTWRWWYQNVKEAAVSPNGKWVVYIFNDNLHLANIRGQNPKLLARGAGNPVWSPEGDKIAYNSGNDLKVISPDGTVLQTLVTETGAYIPSWSPDGKRIAYVGGVPFKEIGCELFEQECPAYRNVTTIFCMGPCQWIEDATLRTVLHFGRR